MGGRVLFALSIAAFPEDFPARALAAVFEAAARKDARGGRDRSPAAHDPRPRAEVRAAVIGAAHPTGCCARAARAGRRRCC
jgi:hypothetical protein